MSEAQYRVYKAVKDYINKNKFIILKIIRYMKLLVTSLVKKHFIVQ